MSICLTFYEWGVIRFMKNEYEIVEHASMNSFKIFLVNLLYRSPHLHADYEICYVLEGTVTVISQNREICISKNNFVVFNPCQVHELKTNDYALLLGMQIGSHFCKDYFPQIIDMEFDICSSSEYISPKINHLLLTTAAELACYYFRKEIGFEFRCMGLLNLLFYHITQSIPYKLHAPSEQSNLASRNIRIQRISNYINENFDNKLLLSDLSANENLTVSYLSHFFKEYFHMSFQNYLMTIRCEKARQLLLLTKHNLLDISIESGFSDIKYLTKAFATQYSCTPKQYRKNLENAELSSKQLSILSTQEFFSPSDSLVVLDKYY